MSDGLEQSERVLYQRIAAIIEAARGQLQG